MVFGWRAVIGFMGKYLPTSIQVLNARTAPGREVPRPTVLLALLLLVLLPFTAAAQHPDPPHHAHPDAPPRLSGGLGAQAIGVVTHAAPALFGRSLTEGYLTQPVLMAHLQTGGERLRLHGMLNFEGVTLRRGELNAGVWGEGYVDRRHPHTFLHEVMATARLLGGPAAAGEVTLSFGKGFAPFGTDDPMARPFVKFPVNHHLAQVLERLAAIAAVRYGPVIAEGGVFNGDEPDSPSHFVTWARFADSWAVRTTVLPLSGVEAAASYAAIASPEFPAGSGLDHRKFSASLRWEQGAGRADGRYALLEWARTDESSGERRSFSFASVLGEAAVRRRGTEVAARFERTLRPEEERLLDPFRSPRPHADANILGATRWQVYTARLSHAVRPGGFGAAPFVEIARLRATEGLRPSVFVPADFYGSDRMWSVSAGVRLQAGATHGRMGRYGAALREPHAGHR
jgi:hypothetical protein